MNIVGTNSYGFKLDVVSIDLSLRVFVRDKIQPVGTCCCYLHLCALSLIGTSKITDLIPDGFFLWLTNWVQKKFELVTLIDLNDIQLKD